MKKVSAKVLIIISVITIALVMALSGHITLESISPNKNRKALIIDTNMPKFIVIDRNFKLQIQDLDSFYSFKTIFISPDENEPGTERFIWSKDSNKLLLVGRDLIFGGNVNKSKIRLKTGEYLYLFYDIRSNIRMCNCNSTQERRFGFEDINNIEFIEDVTPSEL